MLNPLQRVMLAEYRRWRKREPIQVALQMVLVMLEETATNLCESGDHISEDTCYQHLNQVADQIALVNLRRGVSTRHQRYWQTGRLSKPDDLVVLTESLEGIEYLLCICNEIGCAIKHGRAALTQQHIIAFSVVRPNGKRVLTDVTNMTTVADVEAQLAAS